MKEENNIRNFTAADIERYHKRLMSSAEMHALEKAAMDDPFLADALEGYTVEGVNVTNDLNELQNRLAKRTDSSKVIAMPVRKGYYALRVAAMVIVIAGAGILAYTFLNKKDETKLAEVKKENNIPTSPVSDSGNKYQNVHLQTDSGKNAVAVAVETKNKKKVKQLDGSVSLKSDSTEFNFSTANTTRDLATEKAASEPTANALPGFVNEQKQKPNADSLVIVQREASANKKDAEAAPLNEVVVTGLGKSKKLSKAEDRREVNSLGIKNNAYKQPADSTNYSKFNIFRGRVTDASNNGISFANVTVNDVNVGTYADAKGYFSLVAPDSVLNVSLKAVGFNNAQVQLRTILPSNQVVLQEDKSIDPIVMSNKKPNANRSRAAEMVLTEPEPNDGWEKYDDYLANNLKEPDTKNYIPKNGGQVELSFDVNSNGEPVNISVTKSLCKECDEEAIRLLREGPKWKKKKRKEKGKVTIAF